MEITGIYKITSPSGKVYIGQSREIKYRFKQYRGCFCSNQRYLHRSLLKYGSRKHTFEIIHALPSDVDQSVLDKYEQFYMDAYRDCGIELLNLKEAGANGKHSPETIRKMSETQKGRPATKPPWNKGLKTPEDVKRKQSTAAKVRKYTPESYAALTAKRKARIPWNKGLKGVQVNPFKGVPRSEQVKLNMKQGWKNRKQKLNEQSNA